MTLLCSTFFVALISAICPLVNLEAFVAGVGALGTDVNIWAVSGFAAMAQAIGKLFWYQVGASAMRWSYVRTKMESAKWRRCFSAMRQRVDRRPGLGIVFVFFSAAFGLPPLAIMAVLCGQVRFNRALFVATTFAGRTLRFAAVLGGIVWLTAR